MIGRRFLLPALCGLVSIGALAPRPAMAQRQQANVGTSLHNSGDGFFDHTGVNFGFGIPTNGRSGVVGLAPNGVAPAPNIMFGQGGAAAAVPPFGGYTPQADATFGYTLHTSLGNFFFGLSASQGSSRSLTSNAASVTVPNGGFGAISNTSQTPFVTGVVPVVGENVLGERLQRLRAGEGLSGGSSSSANSSRGASTADGPTAPFDQQLAAARDSSAGQPAASIADIRAQQAAEDEAVAAGFREKLRLAEEALAAGKPNVARIYYQQVARRAHGELKRRADDALKSLPARGSSAAPSSSSGKSGSVP